MSGIFRLIWYNLFKTNGCLIWDKRYKGKLLCVSNRVVYLCSVLDGVVGVGMSRTQNNYYYIVIRLLYCYTQLVSNFTLIFPFILVLYLNLTQMRRSWTGLNNIYHSSNLRYKVSQKNSEVAFIPISTGPQLFKTVPTFEFWLSKSWDILG